MSEETTLLLDVVGRWVSLEADALMVVEGARAPLEARVLRLVHALRRAQQRGDLRAVIAVLPGQPHPLRDAWHEPAVLRRHLRRLADGSPNLQWLEEAPQRWEILRGAARWLAPSDDLAATRAHALAVLRLDPRTAGLPADLVLERLLLALQDTPEDPVLGVRALDREALSRVLDGGARALLRWARRAQAQRLALRLQCLPDPVRAALQGAVPAPVPPPPLRLPPAPSRAPPSVLLRATAETVPLLGAWGPLEALLRWCALPVPSSQCLLVGPPGAGKRRIAHALGALLQAVGWRAGHLSVCTSSVAVSVAEGGSGGRQRVLILAESLPASSPPGAEPPLVVQLSPVPPPDRAAFLRLAAAAFAENGQREIPWILPVPDLGSLGWPLDLQMAALAALENRAGVDPAQAAVELERRLWTEPLTTAASRVRDALAGVPPAEDAVLPEAMLLALVEEVLARSPELLHAASVSPAAALLLLDRLAERRPRARLWLRMLLESRPEDHAPLAMAIAADRPLSPLAGVLAELGLHRATGEGGMPLRMVTVHHCRQQLTDQEELLPIMPPEPVALAMGTAAVPSRPHLDTAGRSPTRSSRRGLVGGLAERVWSVLQPRLDVVMPHQIRALELLDQDHRASPRETLARQRVELLVEHVARSPAAAVHLEAALDDLGALLCAGQLQPEQAPVEAEALSAEERQQARAAARHLQDAATLRSQQDGPAAASAFAEATRLLRGLSDRHPALIASDLLHATLEMAALGRALGRPREASATLQALLDPLDQVHERYPPHWPRRSTLLCNLALLNLVAGRQEEARQQALRALQVCPPTSLGESARLDRLAALHTLLVVCPDQTARWEEALAEMVALAEQAPALYRPCLATALDRAARLQRSLSRHDDARRSTLAAVQSVKELASLDATLYAPFEGISLHNLGARLRDHGEHDVAVDVTLDAAEAYRRQARLSGETFLPDLAMTLCNLGAMLAGVARPEQALALTRKTIGVCWGGVPIEALQEMPRVGRLLVDPLPALAPPSPTLLVRGQAREGATRRRPYFLWHLSLLAAVAISPGEGGDEIDVTENLARMWRFEAMAPESLRPGLAAALHNLGVLLGAGGQRGLGREVLQGAVAVWRHLASLQPRLFASPLALALCDLGALCGLDHDLSAALDASTEALRLMDASAAAPLEKAQVLLNHSAALLALGQAAEAVPAAAEAITLAMSAPALRAAALYNLALAAEAQGQHQAARLACLDAVRVDPGDIPERSRLLQALSQRLGP